MMNDRLVNVINTNCLILKNRLEQSNQFSHNGTKGDERENAVIEVIRDCLPLCYGLKTGQIFDKNNQLSKQIDCVIYDAVYSNFFYKNNQNTLFPVESIYGTIEVKSCLDKKELEKALENIKSVKNLYREKSDLLDLTPISRLVLSENTFSYNKASCNEFLNIIFCYDSIDELRILNYIKDSNCNLKELPNFIYIHKKGIILSKVELLEEKSDICKIAIGMNHLKNDGYSISYFGENSLSAFFLLINSMLPQIRLKSIDYMNIINNKNFNEWKEKEDKYIQV